MIMIPKTIIMFWAYDHDVSQVHDYDDHCNPDNPCALNYDDHCEPDDHCNLDYDDHGDHCDHFLIMIKSAIIYNYHDVSCTWLWWA
jgi:hypothetical protein